MFQINQTELQSQLNDKDAVNLEFLLMKTILLQCELFDAGGRRLTNIVDGTNGTDVINARQLNGLKQ